MGAGDLIKELEVSVEIAEQGGQKAIATAREAKTTAIATAAQQSRELDKQRAEQEKLAFLAQFNTLNWKELPPPAVAALLMKKPFKNKDMDIYLQPWQALVFAVYCHEQGVSPFTNEAWFNTQNNTCNLTTEGKKKVARNNGFNLGPPRFTTSERDWPKGRTQIINFAKDVGITCQMDVNGKGDASYTAWLSEWHMDRSPVWREKPLHMLQVRAYEKCISFASGSGVSELPGDADITLDDLPQVLTPTAFVSGTKEFTPIQIEKESK